MIKAMGIIEGKMELGDEDKEKDQILEYLDQKLMEKYDKRKWDGGDACECSLCRWLRE